MSRALGPRPPTFSGGVTGAWVALAGIWSLIGGFGLAWAAARLASGMAGGHVEGFGSGFVIDLLHGRTDKTWPGTPTPLVITFLAVLAAASITTAGTAWWMIARRIPEPGDPVAALSDNPELKDLTAQGVAVEAVKLRASLAGCDPRRLDPADIGLALGDLMHQLGTGPTLYAGWRDTIVAFMAPGGGKTTSQCIPYTLSAPGAVIATSNKNDLWAATADLRAARTGGSIWLFDPQHITYQPQTWWWDPLRGLRTVEEAHRLAGHFTLTVADEKVKDLWGPAAQDLLAALFLAAATSGRSLRDVAAWLDEPAVPTPVTLLKKAGFPLMASSLKGAQNGAVETRDGIYQTARTAAKALRDEEITAWVTPPETPLPVFDPHSFVQSRDTLYLLSEDRSAASPLIAALTDTNLRAARRAADRMGGRLDPVMVVCLDEAANICRVADLPNLYSHLSSRGIIPITILQSYEQGVEVWGESGMAALWGAANKKLIGAGIDSPRLARDVSTLVGQHDVALRSITYSEGRASEQISLRRQEILEPSAVRAMPKGSALLLATGIKPALLKLRPWFTGPDAETIDVHAKAAAHKITVGADQFEHVRDTPPAVDEEAPV